MKKGFTLVELSIVLVIVGLLIGGILIGQSLVESTRGSAQIRQFQQFDAATATFRQKFKQIPGDCNICGNVYGNNNGKLDDFSGIVPARRLEAEPSSFFVSLYKMGIITTPYVDVPAFNGIGKNKECPVAAIGRGGLFVTSNSVGDLFYGFAYTDTVGAGTADMLATVLAEGNLSAEEALAIDAKLDDGIPTTGNIIATRAVYTTGSSFFPLSAETDHSTSCVFGGKYNTSLNMKNLCRLTIKMNYR